MAQAAGSINTDYRDWEWSADAGERARLLQSPSVEAVPKSGESQGNGAGATSALGAVFIVVNAAEPWLCQSFTNEAVKEKKPGELSCIWGKRVIS